MGEEFPKRPEEVTPEWLSERLTDAGQLTNARVAGIEHRAIGTGQVGDSIRFDLSYDKPGAGPASVVGKFASSDATSRGTAQLLKLYLHEVGFFQAIAQHLPVRVPKPVFADIAGDNIEFLLLMEDLGPARQGNQLASCDLDDARRAMQQAAKLHGGSWGRADLISAEFIQPDPQITAMTQALYPQSTATFVERYADAIPARLMEIVRRLGEMSEALFQRKDEPLCLVHGDFRLDNMMFDIKGGAEPLAIVDWQTLRPGNGVEDIGYFLGAGTGAELRRSGEQELLQLYRDEMANHGVDLSDIVFDRGYKRGALHGLSTAVFSAANVVQTERGDANFLSMAMGALELIEDIDALSVLEER
jgi:hypothetical protein